MTEQQFETLRTRQMPDAQKRSLATHIVETLSFDSTRAYVIGLIAHIRARHA
jgi:dephospho-CoA kinase